jgi:hypothetical protein
MDKVTAKLNVLKHIPQLSKIDSEMVSPADREAAKSI